MREKQTDRKTDGQKDRYADRKGRGKIYECLIKDIHNVKTTITDSMSN